MMKCLDCAYENDDTAAHCIQCGVPLQGGREGGQKRKTQLEESAVVATTPAPTPPRPIPPMPAGGPAAAPAAAPSGARRRTMLDEGGEAPTPVMQSPSPAGGRRKTMLDEGPVAPAAAPASGAAARPQTRSPRAIGWMVSFDVNASGQDHVIREGRNSIGRSRDMDISLFYDNTSSDEHAHIIYRNGQCAVLDKGSQNGTYVNEEDIGIGGTRDLYSGDLLTVGKSTFKLFLLDPDESAKTWSAWAEKK